MSHNLTAEQRSALNALERRHVNDELTMRIVHAGQMAAFFRGIGRDAQFKFWTRKVEKLRSEGPAAIW